VIAEQPSNRVTIELAGGEYVVSVAPGYADNLLPERGPGSLIERLVAALNDSGADIAIASPFAPGGRLVDASWPARTATWWENNFLSLAAHGDLATVVGTIRVYRREALARVVKACAGVDLDSEIVLEARRRGVRMIEVPVELTRVPDRNRSSFKSWPDAHSRFWARLRTGLRYRPALWLSLPALVPGLLPLVVALLLIMRATPAQAAFWTIVTLVIQYGSFAMFSWQTSTSVAKRWLRRQPS